MMKGSVVCVVTSSVVGAVVFKQVVDGTMAMKI